MTRDESYIKALYTTGRYKSSEKRTFENLQNGSDGESGKGHSSLENVQKVLSLIYRERKLLKEFRSLENRHEEV